MGGQDSVTTKNNKYQSKPIMKVMRVIRLFSRYIRLEVDFSTYLVLVRNYNPFIVDLKPFEPKID